MTLAILFSMMAGAFGVWQAGLNKVVADSLGFTASLLFNGVFFLVFNLIFFVYVYAKPQSVPAEFVLRMGFSDFRWWWIVPGFMGFALVMGLAVSVARIGAVQTIVISIAAQVFASILWDVYMSEVELSRWRLIGAGITLIGAVLSTLA
jgi:transporter family-2 protein